MRVFFLSIVVLSLQVVTSAGLVFAASPVLKEQCDLGTKTHKGRASGAISSREARPGESLTVDVRFENLGGEQQFFKPVFQPLIPMPARLAVFDSERRYAGDLLRVVGGSQRTPKSEDWVIIPYRGSVGCVLVVLFDAGRAVLPVLERRLSPGRC